MCQCFQINLLFQVTQNNLFQLSFYLHILLQGYLDQKIVNFYDSLESDQIIDKNDTIQSMNNCQTTIVNQKTKHHTYSMIRKVGNGNFGQAYLVESTLDSKLYIMKRISLENRNTQFKEQILKQIKLMQQLNHCYVVRYLQSFVRGKSVCIVMENAQKGDLQKYLEVRRNQGKPLSEQQVIQWFIQLALGLKYIHEKKILHRDLKTDNIFITNGNQMKIGDFGISKLMNETFDLAKTKIGTPFVMAPEIWQDRKYNQKSDIWSLGCVLFKMVTLRYPFEAQNSGALMCKLMSKKIPIIHSNCSEDLKALIYSMLDFEPQKRPSVHKILDVPFIKKHLCQTLEKTINLYDENMSTNQQLRRSTSANRLLKKRDSTSLSSSLLPAKQSSQQYLKIVEFKQNYPVIQQENRCLKQQLEKSKAEREKFEQNTQTLLSRLRGSNISKEDVLSQFQQHILNFLYP